MNEVCYLYGFVEPDPPPFPDDLEGIDGRPVEILELDGFVAAYSLLPEAEYRVDRLSDQVKDLRWITPRGMAHERVVTWFVDHGGIVPASFLTIHSSRDALAEEAAAREDRIRDLLERVARFGEWDLKISCDPERLAAHAGAYSEEIRMLDEQIAAATPGRRYLLERKRAAKAGEIVVEVAKRQAEELLETLRGPAEEVRLIPIDAPAAGPRVVLNAAFLADAPSARSMRAHVESKRRALEEQGFDLSFSGPWAPYRFLDAGPPEERSGLGDEAAEVPE